MGGSVLACGKSEDAPPPEEPAAEPLAMDEAETKQDPQDVAAKDEDAAEAGKTKRPRDRLNRRPPRMRDGDASGEPKDNEAKKNGDEAKAPEAKPPEDPANPNVAGEPVPGVAGEPAPGVAGEPAPGVSGEAVPGVAGEAVPGVAGEPAPGVKVEPPVVEPPRPAQRDLPVGGPLDATRLLPLAQVNDVIQAKGLVDAGVLPGIATTTGYVSVLYKGPAADKFGVSLQVWQDPGRREADDRFKRMSLQYPHAEAVQVLQPVKAFFSHFNGIQMLTFVDSVKRVVATVACGETYCSHEQLTKLAKSVRERL